MAPQSNPAPGAKYRRALGMKVFMQMFIRWLAPSENMRLTIDSELPAGKSFRLFSAYIFCIFTLILMCLLFITEFILGRADLAFLPLAGLALGSILCSLYISYSGNATAPMLWLALYIFVICAYYLVTGNVDEYFLFYYFWVPPMLVFCLHARLGGLLSFVFMAMLTILFLPSVHALLPRRLDPEFRQRFIAAMLCVYSVATLAELVIARIMRSIYKLNTSLEQYSLTDPLTGLGNRRNCINQFQRLHAMQIRSGEPFCIIMIDMDHFKAINDNYGHMLGDEVLRFVAATLNQSLRQQDSLFRWGGEEFIMLLSGSGIEQAEVAAERLRRVIADSPFENEKLSLPLTASFGVYSVTTTQDMQEHLKNVDRLLYHAKASGRNRVASARLVTV